MSQIFQLEQELNEWLMTLPADFMLRNPGSFSDGEPVQDVLLERYRIILTLRYQSTKLLLHRPVFVKSLASSKKSSIQYSGRPVNDSRKRSNTAVIQAAEDIIALVHEILSTQKSGRRLLGAWWFTLYYGKC